jgi:LysM repeat protein
MNTPNPLLPGGGSPQAPRFKSNLKIAIVTILAIHAVLFGGLLLQGCKKDSGDVNATATNALPVFDPLPVPQPDPAVAPGAPVPPPTGLAAPPPAPVPADPNALPPPSVPVPAPIPEPAPAPAMREHIVVKNDSFSSMATQYGVSVAAITAANPGVDSRKLQLGQKIVIPPPTAAPAPAATAPLDAPKTYTVKSGDTLTKVATMHKTTVKALRAANNLKTDAIKVGQKLVIPAPPAPANP